MLAAMRNHVETLRCLLCIVEVRVFTYSCVSRINTCAGFPDVYICNSLVRQRKISRLPISAGTTA